uniref:Uncharacterized protein n=1 Tax=Anopheles atroparvus TaxID=41427 RepID=A0A182IZL6_ANOAO
MVPGNCDEACPNADCPEAWPPFAFGWCQGRLKLPGAGSSGMSSPNACTGTSSVMTMYLSVSTVGWRFFSRSMFFCSRIRCTSHFLRLRSSISSFVWRFMYASSLMFSRDVGTSAASFESSFSSSAVTASSFHEQLMYCLRYLIALLLDEIEMQQQDGLQLFHLLERDQGVREAVPPPLAPMIVLILTVVFDGRNNDGGGGCGGGGDDGSGKSGGSSSSGSGDKNG